MAQKKDKLYFDISTGLYYKQSFIDKSVSNEPEAWSDMRLIEVVNLKQITLNRKIEYVKESADETLATEI